MLNLICGPSGAGKTTLLTKMIASDIENQRRCFLLVPEQQAYISELDLFATLPQNAGLYFEVVNFSRLAEDVFKEYGGVTTATVNTGLRTLLMWDTLRTLSPMLTQYGKSARSDLTLTEMMLRTIDELKMAGIDGITLESAVNLLEKDNPLRKKLSDIAMVEEMFFEKSQHMLGTDPTDKLIRMAQALETNSYFENCNVYIDSFTSFTAQEYSVLREIIRQADQVTVSLCSDVFHSKLPQFESVNETAKRLSKIADQIGIELNKTELPSSKTKKPKTLQILDRDLWRFDLTQENRTLPPIGETDVLHLTTCNNVYEEAEAVAMQILDLVQNGMRYGEIAVVMRDSETYRGVIDAAMERYQIPYFFSERTDLSTKPLSRLILSALRAVDKHYQTQDVIALIKTGLCGIDLRDAALFEEYCETWHIRGSRFTDSLWSMNPDGLTTEKSARAEEILDAANRVRAAVIEPLQALSAALRVSHTITDRCRAVYDYMQKLEIPSRLSANAKKELESGHAREAGDTLRLYRFVLNTLSDIGTLLPDTTVSTEEFISILTLIFSSTDLGAVPNVHDCIMIGSADTMRVEKIRASFIMGLCEGEFPKAVDEDGILSENDKITMESIGLILDSRAEIRASEELLYVYRAMSKPREKLFLSTVAMQTDGSARTPSLAFSRVQFLFGIEPTEFDLSEIRRLTNQKNNEHRALLQIPELPNGTTLRLSQSKIQSFLLCPYRYFSTYTLKLREKKDSTPSYADDGTFLHYVFEHFLSASLQADGRLSIPSEENVEQIADEILSDYLSEVCPLPPELMNSRLLHLFARLRKLAIRMLKDILGELQNSLFVPMRFEQVIGMPGPDGIPPFTIPLQNGSKILLTGKIDRVDFFKKGGKTYFRIVDYKSGKHEFSIKDVKTGMEIQLVLYLFSVLSSDPKNLVAAGAQYLFANNNNGHPEVQRSGFLLNDTEICAAADASEGRIYSNKLILQTADEIRTLADEMTEAVTVVAKRIISGEAEKMPSEDACKFCPVRMHCDKAYHE